MSARAVTVAAAALLLSAAAMPTEACANSDGQAWITAGASVKLGGSWRISQDVVARFGDRRNGLYEIESSTLLGYRINDMVTVAAGYVHNPQYSDGDFSVLERRARQQVSLDNIAKLGSGKLSGRLRFEQRWRQGVDGVGWRLRPYAKYALPLHGKAALNFSTELFVNLNGTEFQRTRGLDRVRNLLSVSGPLTGQLTGEAGYMNQRGVVRGDRDTTDHAAYFAVNLSI